MEVFLKMLLILLLYYKIFGTADVVGLYLNISNQAGLNALKEALEKRDVKKITTEDLVKMAESVLNYNILGFNWRAYQ